MVNKVNLICDYVDASGNPVQQGKVTFTPNAQVLDTSSDHLILTQTPVVVDLSQSPAPTVPLIATDNSGMSPSGWSYLVSPQFPGCPPAQLFSLPYASGATQNLSDLLPVVTSPVVPTGGTYTGTVVLDGSPPIQIPAGAGSGKVLGSDSLGNAAWLAEPAGSAFLLAPTSVKTGNYTAAASDFVRCDTTSAGFTVTLPAAPANGTVIGVKLVASAALVNALTIACSGSDVFNVAGGATTATLALSKQGVIFQYIASGAIWLVMGDDLPLAQLDARYPSVFNVKAYGATGNGTADDTAAIQAAMNAAGPTGGTVSFPPGNYLVSSTLLWKPAAGGLTNQAFYAPSLAGAGQGATGPRFTSYAQGVTQLTASSGFPTGEFLIDYIGDTGSNNCISGYEISGLSLQCSSRAAGIRNCNAHSSVIRRITINSTAVPNPANTIGTPSGALSAVASPTSNAENNQYEEIITYLAGKSAFHFAEGVGSYVVGRGCVSINAVQYGFIAGDGTVLVGCSAQGSGVAGFADFQVYEAILIGCNNQGWTNGCNGNALHFVGNNNRQACVIGGYFSGNQNADSTGGNAAMITTDSGGEGFDVVIEGVCFKTGSHTTYWLNLPGTSTSGKFSVQGCSFNTAGGALTGGSYTIAGTVSGTWQVSIKNCPGLNPIGSVTVAVPATTVATAALPHDATFYITAASGGSTTAVISGGPTITIPASALATVRVPAAQTLTPTYGGGNAPTWVVEGD